MNGLTVVCIDSPGLIADLCARLASGSVNIACLNGRVVGTQAVLHLDVDNLTAAVRILTEAGCSVIAQDIVAFVVEDAPGALARIAEMLTREKVDIRLIRTITRDEGFCILAIVTDDNARARLLLDEHVV